LKSAFFIASFKGAETLIRVPIYNCDLRDGSIKILKLLDKLLTFWCARTRKRLYHNLHIVIRYY